MIDASAQCSADFVLSEADILAHEAAHGLLPRGAVVLVYFGWARAHSAAGARAYFGYTVVADAASLTDGTAPLSFPGLGASVCALLIARGVVGVGVDTASLDAGSCTAFTAHRMLLGAGIFGA